MKRNRKEENFKDYLKKKEELSKNWDAQRKLGYKPLDVPIHNGYDAEWVLREDVARSPEAEKYESILFYYGESSWHKNEDFKSWDKFYKRYDIKKPYFKRIRECDYDNLYPWAKKFFTYDIGNDVVRWGSTGRMYKVSIPEYMLKIKVTKHYDTHYKVIDEVLLQEEAEIEDEIRSKFWNHKVKNEHGHSAPKSYCKIFNRNDRAHNKIALKNNCASMIGKSFWNYFDSDDEVEKEYRYNHKHSCRWYCS